MAAKVCVAIVAFVLLSSASADAQEPSKIYAGVGFARDSQSGVLVLSQVTPGGPGAKAGLKEDDVVTKIDGVVPKDADDCVRLVRKKDAGNGVTFTVTRGGKQADVVVTLVERTKQTERLDTAYQLLKVNLLINKYEADLNYYEARWLGAQLDYDRAVIYGSGVVPASMRLANVQAKIALSNSLLPILKSRRDDLEMALKKLNER